MLICWELDSSCQACQGSLAAIPVSFFRDALQQARALSPAIIFIDEIDAVGRSRGGQQGNDERDQTLNQVPVLRLYS